MPSDPKSLAPLPPPLVSAVKAGKCILFLGAAVNAPPPVGSGYDYPQEQRPPLAGALARDIADMCGYKTKFPDESAIDLQRVSLCYETDPNLGRNVLVTQLQERLGSGKRPSPALRMLAQLPFRIFVTTNYDHLLESALAGSGSEKTPEVFVYDPKGIEPTQDTNQDPPDTKRPLVFKMHGDLAKPESIVITDEDYITFVQRMSDKDQIHPVPKTIRYSMTKWPILFVGYSLRDYNLRLLFRTLRWQLDNSRFPPCFSVDFKPDPLIVQVWQYKRSYVTFIAQDLWAFVPQLFREVTGEEFRP
jgi:hypothetical protein